MLKQIGIGIGILFLVASAIQGYSIYSKYKAMQEELLSYTNKQEFLTDTLTKLQKESVSSKELASRLSEELRRTKQKLSAALITEAGQKGSTSTGGPDQSTLNSWTYSLPLSLDKSSPTLGSVVVNRATGNAVKTVYPWRVRVESVITEAGQSLSTAFFISDGPGEWQGRPYPLGNPEGQFIENNQSGNKGFHLRPLVGAFTLGIHSFNGGIYFGKTVAGYGQGIRLLTPFVSYISKREEVDFGIEAISVRPLPSVFSDLFLGGGYLINNRVFVLSLSTGV